VDSHGEMRRAAQLSLRCNPLSNGTPGTALDLRIYAPLAHEPSIHDLFKGTAVFTNDKCDCEIVALSHYSATTFRLIAIDLTRHEPIRFAKFESVRHRRVPDPKEPVVGACFRASG
jgi:hypothetical protein